MGRHGRIVALDGPSAAGKSTLAAALGRRPGWVALAEAFDRLEPRPSLRYRSERELLVLERRLLAEESRRWAAARAIAAKGRHVVADTGFLGPWSYTAALGALGLSRATVFREVDRRARALADAGRLGLPDLTVLLEPGAAQLRAHARADPGRHPPELLARHWAVSAFERATVLPWLRRAVPGRVVRLRPSRSADGSAAAIVRRTAGLRPLRGASERLAQALGRFVLPPVDVPAVTLMKGAPSARALRR